MPTGYTSSLEDKKYDIKSWLLEDVIRNFGVCVCMRDDGQLSKDDILAKLKKETANSYHKKELDSHRKKLSEALIKTDKDWEEDYEKKFEYDMGYYQNEVAKVKKKSAIWDDVKAKLLEYQEKAEGEIITNAIKFAIDQWDLVEMEYKKVYTEKPVKNSPEKYRELVIDSLHDDIIYHKKNLKEDTERETKRYKAYQDYIESVDALFKDTAPE